ncbi:MAG: hypothetical protein SF339_27150 [Blastocatellia bacterium]|nr:hypothetical protein [Blastocatellia bacterium]
MAESQLPIMAVKISDLLPAFAANHPFTGAFTGNDDLSLVGFGFENANSGQIQRNFKIGHVVESSLLFPV